MIRFLANAKFHERNVGGDCAHALAENVFSFFVVDDLCYLEVAAAA